MPLDLSDVPDSCARCGAPTVAMIVYGMPDETLEEAASRGEVALGGCIVPQPQRWSCSICGYAWPLPPEAIDSDLVRDAFALAVAARRGAPGLEHPVEVAHMLYEEGYGAHVVAAGLLHDVVEHACIGFCELEDRFGHDVAALVDVLTEQSEICDYDKRRLVQRARVISAGRRAAVIYAADRLSSLRTLRAAYSCDGERVASCSGASLDERLVNAERDIRMLERSDPPLPFVQELEVEHAMFRADRRVVRCNRHAHGVAVGEE